MTADVEVLAHNGDIDGVGEVGVEDVGMVAVGEHLFDLVGIWVRKRHGWELMTEVDLFWGRGGKVGSFLFCK